MDKVCPSDIERRESKGGRKKIHLFVSELFFSVTIYSVSTQSLLHLLEVYTIKLEESIKSSDNGHFSICVLFRSFPSLDQTPQCDPCVTFGPNSQELV